MVLLPNGQVSSTPIQTKIWPIFQLAFRPFFWLGALFGTLSIATWGLAFTGHIEFNPLAGIFFWHAHEMLFGFIVAIIAGFLLTAVQTWTGFPSIKGKSLALLVLVWLAARILLAFPFLSSAYLIIAIDLLFLPLAAFFLAIPIIKAKLWRNLIFVPILLLMAALNTCMHLAAQGLISVPFLTISHIMVLMVTLVMCVMGGRVFPMFTANGTQTKQVPAIAWLEQLSILSVIASILVTSDLINFSPMLAASIYLVAGLSNFVRALRWRIWVTTNTPLVWSLHLSYWAISAGLIMLGLAKLDILSNATQAFHSITVGGSGLMILSMISRVSLGHTGRMIQPSKAMTFAFGLLVLTFFSRVLAPLLFSQYSIIILLSAALWVLAYTTFLVIYLPILFKPRVDGAPG